MNRWFLFLSIFTLAIALLSCDGLPFSFALAPTPIPAPTPMVQLTLVGYKYKTKDVGGGWNQGTVSLVLENNTNTHAGFYATQLPSPTIETQEGQTYTGELRSDSFQYPLCSQVQQVPLIPPGARQYAGCAVRGETYAIIGTLYADFRFAVAAHPVAITFPGTKHRIDLSAATKTIESLMFASADSRPFKSVTEFYGRVLVDDPSGAKVSVKGCNVGVRDPYVRTPNLALVIENRDKFRDTQVTVTFPTRVGLFKNGFYTGRDDTPTYTYTVGPGQTTNGWLPLAHGEYVLVYDEFPNKYTVYDASNCFK